MHKKSNVEKGNDFEDEAKGIIYDLLKKGELAIAPEYHKMEKKPRYYNTKRETKIQFDWSAQIYPEATGRRFRRRSFGNGKNRIFS